MTQKQGTIIVFMLVALLLTALSTAFFTIQPHFQSEEWEYTIEGIPDLQFKEVLDDLGTSGWEIVSARRARNSRDQMMYECILKRRAR